MELNVVSKWDERYIELAKLVASWSKDPHTICGAVIVRPDKTIASVGFNGFPRGTKDDGSLYADRELKRERVVHAEMNAILHASESVKGYTMYTYQYPMIGPSCARCTAHIIQAGIAEVVCPPFIVPEHYKDSIKQAFQMYDEAMVNVRILHASS